jgi:hypothetical protein
MLRLILALVLLTAGSLAQAAELRVLFIGNSLTYTNQLPKMLVAVARAAGGPAIRVEQRTRPGFSLEDHLQSDRLENRIRNGNFDFVIMQQGPSALPESRVLLRRDVAIYADIIREGGAEPAIYTVWPEGSRVRDLPEVIESYRLAAEDVGARLLPVGLAWQTAWEIDPAIQLYGQDGFHPSMRGTYLAALVIYEGLTGRSAVGIPGNLRYNGKKTRISDADAATLQEAAEQVRQPQVLARP